MTRSFRAFYEDAAKTEAAARAEGYDGNNGSLMDFVEPHDYRTGRTFKDLVEAEQWLRTEINAMKTVFGCGTIRAQEQVTQRCQYCVCDGIQNLHEYIVDNSGIVDEEELENECLDG